MQTKSILLLLGAVFWIGTVCVCLGGYFLFGSLDPFAAMGQPDNGDGTYGPKPAHQCSTTVDGYEFSIELNLIHPFLAEYEKLITISAPDGTVLTSEKFIDTGGFATFYFFRNDQNITIIDGLGEGVSIQKHGNATARDRFPELVDTIESDSIGRSMFRTNGYQYLDAGEVVSSMSAENAD